MAAAANAFTVLSDWQTVEIDGSDARDFLNRLTSANFARLQPGEFSPGTLLTPNGKLTLYFKALVFSDKRYLLLVPGLAQGAHDIFERVHFREALTIRPEADGWMYLRVVASDQSHQQRLWAALDCGEVAPGHFAETKSGLLAFNENHWVLAPITLDVGLAVPKAKLAETVKRLADAGFSNEKNLEGFRLRAADPAVPSELNEHTIPLEARLDDAVHEGKGCYPGQEVIERIRSMGQPPRVLVAIRGQGHAPERTGGAELAIMAGDQAAGVITSVVDDATDGGWVALGYLKRTFAKPDSNYTVAAQPVSLRIK